jgi:Flp pilus assembly pilin Flp
MASLLQSILGEPMANVHLPSRISRYTAKVRELVRDKRGAITTEYVIVVGTMSLLIVGALVSVGPLLLASYERSRALLIAPFP